jgi:hypothetical protein
MITAETIQKLSNLSTRGLDQALSNAGYRDVERVMDREFLGITNGGEFCYKFTYRDEESWSYGKLFVKFNDAGLIVAEY